MLIIREAQVEAFRAIIAHQFRVRMVRRLAAVFPARFVALGEDGVQGVVTRGYDRAMRHGIHREGDVAALIELAAEHGPGVETLMDEGWARGVLEHPGLSGSAKVQVLRHNLAGRAAISGDG